MKKADQRRNLKINSAPNSFSGERRFERFSSEKSNPPTVTCRDPLRPEKTLLFRVADLSKTGLLLNSSFEDRHLFPGMEFNQATIDFPNVASLNFDLVIENTRSNSDGICFGVSIKGESAEYTRTFTKYITGLGARTSHAKGDLKIQEFKNTIDPDLTQQQLHASVLLPYLLVSDDIIGREKTDQILTNRNFTREYFFSPTNWVSIRFFDYFIAAFSSFGDPKELHQEAGYKNLSKDVLGINHFLLKHFLTPQAAFKAFGTYLPKFNKTRTYEVLTSGPNFCRIRLGLTDPELKPKDPSTKLNWEAILDAHVLVITGKHGRVQTIKSIFNGDAYCEFVVTWELSFMNKWRFLKAMLLTLAFGYGLYLVKTKPWLSLDLFATLCAFLFGGYSIFKYSQERKKYDNVVESITALQKDADVRYDELQSAKGIVENNYHESQLLEKLNRDVQTSKDLTQVLETSLESLATNFNLKRSVILLLDKEKNVLRTSAIKGFQEHSSYLWSFAIPVKRNEDPFLVGLAFSSGQSIFIADVSSHEFQLNQETREILYRLGMRSFLIVPIPSESGQWGVIIADKGDEQVPVNRRDLVTLQRVCQALGIALDKKGKFDAEQKTRKLFEKYVPSNVVNSALGLEEVRLGGESKEAICLFMDIRNFTNLSSTLPPAILCDLLNQVFELFTQIMHARSGFVDKFLGDGALVTWGVAPGSPLGSHLAIQASIEFCRAIDELNGRIVTQGFAPLNVGVGIHRGEVIAGNIGSHQRMEFTIIGNTVNIASRLEQLNKVYGSNVVISAAVMNETVLDDEKWTAHKSVTLRGSPEPIDIAVYHDHSLGTRLKIAA